MHHHLLVILQTLGLIDHTEVMAASGAAAGNRQVGVQHLRQVLYPRHNAVMHNLHNLGILMCVQPCLLAVAAVQEPVQKLNILHIQKCSRSQQHHLKIH